MKEISNKWPHVVIVGEAATKEQAKDFILRTEPFLYDTSEYSGGNNQDWNKLYRDFSGLSSLPEDDWHASGKIKESLDFVSLDYFQSQWASCAYIGGPHGLVSPEGKVYFNQNIGKWPSNEEVVEDLKRLAAAFPWLTLKGSIYDYEQHDDSAPDDVTPLFSFVMKEGNVEFNGEDYRLRQENPVAFGDITKNLFSSNRTEQGLPSTWVEEYAEIVLEKVKELNKDN